MIKVYYNENDQQAASLLRAHIASGRLPHGDVDDRSIEDVTPNDLDGYHQCHFFAGIGGWALALRQAGFEGCPCWTASLPCQPFSSAGKGKGTADERHLWPAFHWLIRQCRPPVVFGEQVAGKSVTGPNTTIQRGGHLHALWRRKETLGVLQDWLEGNLPEYMQKMPKHSCEGMEGFSKGDGVIQSAGISEECQGESEEERIAVRSNDKVGRSDSGKRILRVERTSVRSEFNPASMELPVAGSDNARGWVYGFQYSDSVVLGEYWMRYLGREHPPARGTGDYRKAKEEIGRAIEAVGRELDAEDGDAWLLSLQFDLEREGYTTGAAVFPACGVGAPHIRKRLYWVACDKSIGFNQWAGLRRKEQAKHRRDKPPHSDSVGGMGDTHDTRPQGHAWHGDGSGKPGREQAEQAGQEHNAGKLADNNGHGCEVALQQPGNSGETNKKREADWFGSCSPPDTTGPVNGFWRAADWLYCRDGKWRPVEPGSFPLVDGIPARVAQAALRGYGNAIVIPQAVAYIQATMGALRDSI